MELVKAYGNAELRKGPRKPKESKWAKDAQGKTNGTQEPANCTEFEFIQGVIKQISSTISNHGPLFVAKHPVGIDIRVEAIESLLDMESNDVRMVGICGFGGIGKTTISKAIYNRIAHRFEGSCFLENVREMSKINGGIIQLQETLLSKIIRNEYLKVSNVSEGIELIKKRLRSKKVLLILDDVEDLKEVENLLGEYNWFASGSRVIITTRDKHVLNTLGRDPPIYEVTKLNQSEARELFNLHAFHTSEYGEDYSELVEQIICYANGLPLALKVIGSDLCGKKIYEWKSALEKYKNIPHKNIQEMLKISYDGLENFEKEIFLDIACFFKGYNKNDVANILYSCELYPDYGIRKLIDKCLITLEYAYEPRYDFLSMHDLVQQMGREIAQQESKKLQQRSRIWRYKDAHELLTGNMCD
ncbi:TMV resistance protein N-like [Quercus suber]|uniref:TMV resistance protein N-like n=1 Tax=Quercus suber TaxID=58331 RepID=UPI0032DEC814